jgi:hypothetical protein
LLNDRPALLSLAFPVAAFGTVAASLLWCLERR